MILDFELCLIVMSKQKLLISAIKSRTIIYSSLLIKIVKTKIKDKVCSQ